MFFYLSKTIGVLLDPANLLAVLFCAALFAFAIRRVRAGRFLLLSSFALLLVFGILPIGHNGLYYLESRNGRPTAMPDQLDGVLILGGAIETQKSGRSGQTEFNEGAERVLSAMALSRDYPDAIFLFSGGSNKLFGSKRSEADEVAIFMEIMGFATKNIAYEEKSRNTFENFQFSFQKIAPEKKENWLLVTSAFHMPRSLAIARKMGWDLIPYPVDYRSQGRYLLLPPKLDVLDNLYASKLFLREMTGFAAYKITGKL
ncbi:MAG: YdcF family protein [Micavibrio sp.]